GHGRDESIHTPEKRVEGRDVFDGVGRSRGLPQAPAELCRIRLELGAFEMYDQRLLVAGSKVEAASAQPACEGAPWIVCVELGEHALNDSLALDMEAAAVQDHRLRELEVDLRGCCRQILLDPARERLQPPFCSQPARCGADDGD